MLKSVCFYEIFTRLYKRQVTMTNLDSIIENIFREKYEK